MPEEEEDLTDGGKDTADKSQEESKLELQQRIALLTNNVSSLEDQVRQMARQLSRRSVGPSSVRSSSIDPIRSPRAVKEKELPSENTFLTSLGDKSYINPLSD